MSFLFLGLWALLLWSLTMRRRGEAISLLQLGAGLQWLYWLLMALQWLNLQVNLWPLFQSLRFDFLMGMALFAFGAEQLKRSVTHARLQRRKLLYKFPLLGGLVAIGLARLGPYSWDVVLFFLSALYLIGALFLERKSERPITRIDLLTVVGLVALLLIQFGMRLGSWSQQIWLTWAMVLLAHFYFFKLFASEWPNLRPGRRWFALWGMTLLLGGCSKISTLNLEEHYYEVSPTKIIWLQIAGLSEEHLLLIRANLDDAVDRLGFEKASCVGKVWSNTLHQLRPNAFWSFQAQLTGSGDLRQQCSDFTRRPLWNYLAERGYETAIVEQASKEEGRGFSRLMSCEKELRDEFLLGLYLWKLEKRDGPATKELADFHIYNKISYEKGKIYYDTSCQQEQCYTSYAKNVEFLYENFSKNRYRYLFMVRDFTYLQLLKGKDPARLREHLLELIRIYNYFFDSVNKNKRTLLLVTTAENYHLSFPREGNEWARWEKGRTATLGELPALMGTVLAYGARAENFCGIYDQVDIFRRLMQAPQRKNRIRGEKF